MIRIDLLRELESLQGQPKVSYAGDSTAHPIVERLVQVRRGTTFTLGQADVETGRFPSATLVFREEVDSDIQFARYYLRFETLPGPWIPFTRYDDRLGPVQGRRRAVLASGQAASLTSTTKKTYEGRDGSSVVLWEIEETWSNGSGTTGNPAYPIRTSDLYDDERGAVEVVEQTVVATGSEAATLTYSGGTATRTTYTPVNQFLLDKRIETWGLGPALTVKSIGQDSLVPAKFRRKVRTTETTTPVAPSTNPPSSLTGDQTRVSIEKRNVAEAKQIVVEETIEAGATPLEGAYIDTQGIVLTEESLVDEGEPPAEGALVKSSRVSPTGDGKAIKEVEQYGEYPEFVEEEMDTQLWVPRTVEKKILPIADSAKASFSTVVDGLDTFALITEYKQFDKWKTVRIKTRTKLSGSGTDGLLERTRVWYGVEQYSFPSELISADVVLPSGGSTGLSDLAVEVRMKDGYSGPVKARYTESFHSSPPAAPTLVQYRPQSFYGHMTTRRTLLGGVELGAEFTTIPIRIPSCLHDTLNIDLPLKGWTVNGSPPPDYNWSTILTLQFGTIAATSPTSIGTPGDYIVKGFEVTPYAFNIWRALKTEIMIP